MIVMPPSTGGGGRVLVRRRAGFVLTGSGAGSAVRATSPSVREPAAEPAAAAEPAPMLSSIPVTRPALPRPALPVAEVTRASSAPAFVEDPAAAAWAGA